MPQTARPREIDCTVAMAQATAAALRVIEFVTPVCSLRREVTFAACARAMKESPDRFCESTTLSPSQPPSSASFALCRMARGALKAWVQSSM